MSQSYLQLSKLGQSVRDTIIISESPWPSWLFVLDLFLETSTTLQQIVVFVPNFVQSNMFGTNRNKRIKLQRLDLKSSLSSRFASSIGKHLSTASMILFEGSALALDMLIHQCLHTTVDAAPPFMALTPGNIHLRHLKTFHDLHWLKIKHPLCGGVTSISFWLGFNHPFRDTHQAPPVYCNQALSDILEFAPSGAKITPVHDLAPVTLTRSPLALPHASLTNTWWCHGLLPPAAITTTREPVAHVVTPSLFTTTGWCSRALTARELARCFYLPVPAETRVLHAFPALLPSQHPLRQSVPCKLLAQSLWLCGMLNNTGGGLTDSLGIKGRNTPNITIGHTMFSPAFGLDPVTQQIVSQNQFNLSTVTIEGKAVKMDEASVPVMLWDNRLLKNYPTPHQLTNIDHITLSSTLNTLRRFCLSIWRRRVYLSFVKYLRLQWKDLVHSYVNKPGIPSAFPNEVTPLTEIEWLKRGQGLGEVLWKNVDGMEVPVRSSDDTFLWAPAPAIADIALEYLRTSIHRRPESYHIFVCPKLMTYKWRKNLLKTCDLSFYVDTGVTYWPEGMHENLLIVIYLPLLHCHPWTYRGSRTILEVERHLRKVSDSKGRTQGSVLCQFFKFTRRLSTMQDGLVRHLLSKGQIR